MYRWREPPIWDVFGPDGAFLGRVTLPPDHRIAAAKGRTLIALRQGEWDETYVVVFGIR